jgi:transcriptional regulator with XRE-family HTH domain
MAKTKKVKGKEEESNGVPTRVSEIISEGMKKKNVDIKALAATLGVTYETVRSVVRGLVVPSKFILKPIADVLGLDEDDLDRAAVSDRIRKKYGTMPLEISGKNPELDPLERVWQYISEEHKKDLIAMANMYAKRDRE